MNDLEIFLLFLFGIITLFCFVGWILSPDKKYLIPLEKKGGTVYRVNGIGTCMYGLRTLDIDQLKYYGFEQFEHEGKLCYPLATFKTTFISIFWIPLIPLRTQIIIDADDEKFYPFPVEMYWEQVFAVLSCSYFGMLFFTIMITLGITGVIGLLIGTCSLLVLWLIFKKKKSELKYE